MASRVSAATSATGSPMYLTRSEASTGISTSSSPRPPLACSKTRLTGTSAAVSTARTPGTASAAAVSIETIRADGTRLRTTRPCSIPGSSQSAAYSSVPLTFSTKSWLATLVPTTR